MKTFQTKPQQRKAPLFLVSEIVKSTSIANEEESTETIKEYLNRQAAAKNKSDELNGMVYNLIQPQF